MFCRTTSVWNGAQGYIECEFAYMSFSEYAFHSSAFTTRRAPEDRPDSCLRGALKHNKKQQAVSTEYKTKGETCASPKLQPPRHCLSLVEFVPSPHPFHPQSRTFDAVRVFRIKSTGSAPSLHARKTKQVITQIASLHHSTYREPRGLSNGLTWPPRARFAVQATEL